MATQTAEPAGNPVSRIVRIILTERVALLAILLVIMVGWLKFLEAGDYLTAPYDISYMASALESMVPLCLLAIAELVVMVSGRGGIDLSVGAMVSLSGMVFGFLVGKLSWPVLPAIVVCLLCGAVLGAINGALVAYLRFPALIATLATYYAFSSISLVSSHSDPISDKPVQDLHSLTQPVTVGFLPPFPLQVLTFLLPCVVVAWLVLSRTTYGRKLYAVGTNDAAARFASIRVSSVRFRAFSSPPASFPPSSPSSPLANSPPPVQTPAPSATAWPCPPSPSPFSAASPSPAASAASAGG
ncbi:ABC transporter permease [Fodinicola feengrottensis]|uniref:ABC transporter permease n=1 Tax=Fodinicola feengrottensis TaxID=435914 RepID=UPI00244307C3|nr:ABC transporter permease [Fodinicola feengrottensis]